MSWKEKAEVLLSFLRNIEEEIAVLIYELELAMDMENEKGYLHIMGKVDKD